MFVSPGMHMFTPIPSVMTFKSGAFERCYSCSLKCLPKLHLDKTWSPACDITLWSCYSKLSQWKHALKVNTWPLAPSPLCVSWLS